MVTRIRLPYDGMKRNIINNMHDTHVNNTYSQWCVSANYPGPGSTLLYTYAAFRIYTLLVLLCFTLVQILSTHTHFFDRKAWERGKRPHRSLSRNGKKIHMRDSLNTDCAPRKLPIYTSTFTPFFFLHKTIGLKTKRHTYLNIYIQKKHLIPAGNTEVSA